MTQRELQEKAAQKVSHLKPEQIVCKYCGESTASNSFKGYAHIYGPKNHLFIAKKPGTNHER